MISHDYRCLSPMRRIASVLIAKRDDDGRPKKSWKPWLRRRPAPTHDLDLDLDDADLSSLIAFTRLSLTVPPSVPPFAPHSLFPRSMNPPCLLPQPPSLRRRVLKSAILHRCDSQYQEQPCIVSDFPNISRPPVSHSSSPGLRRWLSRPCFEDRTLIYSPLDSGIILSQVSASLPVAAIEFSEHLASMADPGVLQAASPTGMLFLDAQSSISFITLS
jgi:hypothetical protein